MFTLDFSQTVTVATSSSDASLTVPAISGNPISVAGASTQLSYWYIFVEGAPVYVNYNATASSSAYTAVLPVCAFFKPVRLQPGAVLHFVATTGSGFVSIVRANV